MRDAQVRCGTSPVTGPQPPERGRIRRAARSVRSGLRRYPRAIAGSLLAREGAGSIGVTEYLHRLAPHDLALAWLGHATVVCQIGDAVVVVDPVLSDRIGPKIGGRTVGPRRQTPPPVSPAALRGVDVVLITHAHFDHLDRPTLEGMVDPRTRVVVPPGCARLVPPGFAGVLELGVGRTESVSGVGVRAIEPRHWGARVAVDRHRAVNGYLVSGAGASVLMTGDTAATDAFDGLAGVDVAVFGIGAYDPWEHMHATPEQVWGMFERTGARYLLPVHHSTFELSDEPTDAPMKRLLRAAGVGAGRVLGCEPGDVLVIEPSDRSVEGGSVGE